MPITALMMRRRGRAGSGGAVQPDPRAKFALGANLSGAETSTPQFPASDEMGYFASKGVKTFRLPLLWDKIQPTQAGALASDYMDNVSSVLATAAGLGCTVLIDVHSYGIAYGMTLGTSGFPVSSFADLWSRLSTFFQADPNYAAIRGYDLQNEWHDMDPNAGPGVNSTAYSQNLIASANQAAINAIRANGDAKTIYVEGDHFSGAWDWVTNNGAWAAALTDPANNLIFSVHCYLDSDSSGGHFVWADEAAKPGYAPPGLATNVNIGPQRLAAVTAWAAQNGKRLHVGESGWSNDLLAQGGNDDYVHWNQAGDALLAHCQANKIEFDIWGAGPTFPSSYGYNPEPTSITDPGAKDFTSAGLQSTQMVVLQKYTGYTGAQPVAYRADVPFNAIPYAPPGTAIPNFKIRYNGKVSNPITFTGHATLADGTDAGGTFSPITIPAGDNGIATFSYTPAGAYAGIRLAFTNNAGLTDPPAIGCASVSDFFIGQGSVAPNIYSLRLRNSTYVGPAVRLQRASDATQRDFSFNNRGDLPRQAIQDWAGSRTIPVATWYDQSPLREHIAFGTKPNLILVDSNGYPSINVPNTVIATANTPSRGQGRMSVYARVNPANGGDIVTQDFYSANFRLTASSFLYAPNGNPITYVAVGAASGAWSDIVTTYSNLYTTGNLKSYLNGSPAASVSAPAFVNASGANAFSVFNFPFGDQHYQGSITDLFLHYVEWTAAQASTLHSDAATYYSTALPDALGAVVPTISGTGPVSLFGSGSATPFSGATIADTNGGGPTDTVSIALSGAAGTLSGGGLSGTGPYTLASDTAANLTTKLRALALSSSAPAGSQITLTLNVTSSAGTSATDAHSVVTVAAYGVEATYPAPSGTFTPRNMKGVNITGGGNIGAPIYPRNYQVNYYPPKGFGLIRMQIDHGNIMTGRAGSAPIAADALTGMKNALDNAFAQNMYVIIDMHTFGGALLPSSTSAGIVGKTAGAADGLADAWSRIASRFKNYPNVIFGIMNEPGGMTIQQWHDGCLPSIAAIRATGANQLILIPGIAASGAHWWVSSAVGTAWDTFNQPGWTGMNGDPANNFAFDVHQYLDRYYGGYDATAAYATTNGLPYNGSNGQNGAALLDLPGGGQCTTWLRSHGFKALLTEFGFAPATWKPSASTSMHYDPAAADVQTNGPAAANAMLSYMDANADVWMGWACWWGGAVLAPPASGGDAYCTDPSNYNAIVDQPQIATLTAHL